MRHPCGTLASGLLSTLLLLAPTAAAQREQRKPLERLDLTPLTEKARKAGARLDPVAAGDMVLIGTTLRLFAFEARTGALAWATEPPAGWSELEKRMRDEFFGGIDWEHLWATPAASGSVAVSALQVPLGQPDPDWQGIQTRETLPERRLFAFELATGRPLWDHAPPLDGELEHGPHEERMRVCGAPLVVGARVLVPCTGNGSSIDYHVSGYELASGALAWSTFVTRGQVDRNQFGYQVREFAAAPLVVAGQRVLAQTGLGTVAALDLASGRILWQTDYPALPFPKARDYPQTWARATVWRNAAPLVLGDVLLAAPLDSAELLAFDLATGELLWSAGQELLFGRAASRAFDHMIVAEADSLCLGGPELRALAVGSWRAPGPWSVRWTKAAPVGAQGPVHASGDALFVPRGSGLLELDRNTGAVRREHATGPLQGLLVTEGALFVLADARLERIAR